MDNSLGNISWKHLGTPPAKLPCKAPFDKNYLTKLPRKTPLVQHLRTLYWKCRLTNCAGKISGKSSWAIISESYPGNSLGQPFSGNILGLCLNNSLGNSVFRRSAYTSPQRFPLHVKGTLNGGGDGDHAIPADSPDSTAHGNPRTTSIVFFELCCICGLITSLDRFINGSNR